MKSRGRTGIRIHEIREEKVGLKDTHKTLFGLWNYVFKLPASKQ